ncbi:hypothetical protein Tco_0901999 [Tanacetum coccineum]
MEDENVIDWRAAHVNQIGTWPMPIFHMSMSLKVPAGVIQILESLRSKFFNGHESSGKKASWVQWKKALAPKDNGGLEETRMAFDFILGMTCARWGKLNDIDSLGDDALRKQQTNYQ